MDDVTICSACNCATHTIDGYCGKCGYDKPNIPKEGE